MKRLALFLILVVLTPSLLLAPEGVSEVPGEAGLGGDGIPGKDGTGRPDGEDGDWVLVNREDGERGTERPGEVPVQKTSEGSREPEVTPLYKPGGDGETAAGSGNGDDAPKPADLRTATQQDGTSPGKTNDQQRNTPELSEQGGDGLGERQQGAAETANDTAGKTHQEIITMREDNLEKLEEMKKLLTPQDGQSDVSLAEEDEKFLKAEYERLFGKKKNGTFASDDDIYEIMSAQKKEIALLKEGVTQERIREYSKKHDVSLAQAIKNLHTRQFFVETDSVQRILMLNGLIGYQETLQDAIDTLNVGKEISKNNFESVNKISQLFSGEKIDTSMLKTKKEREALQAQLEALKKVVNEEYLYDKLADDHIQDANFLEKISRKKQSELSYDERERLGEMSKKLLGEDIISKSSEKEEYQKQFEKQVEMFKNLLKKESEHLKKFDLTPKQVELLTQINGRMEYIKMLERTINDTTLNSKEYKVMLERINMTEEWLEQQISVTGEESKTEGAKTQEFKKRTDALRIQLDLLKLDVQEKYLETLKGLQEADLESHQNALKQMYKDLFKVEDDAVPEQITPDDIENMESHIIQQRASEASKSFTEALEKKMPEPEASEESQTQKPLSIKERFERLLQKIQVRIKAIFGNKEAQVLLQKAGRDAENLETLLLIKEPNKKDLQKIKNRTKKLISAAKELEALQSNEGGNETAAKAQETSAQSDGDGADGASGSDVPLQEDSTKQTSEQSEAETKAAQQGDGDGVKAGPSGETSDAQQQSNEGGNETAAKAQETSAQSDGDGADGASGSDVPLQEDSTKQTPEQQSEAKKEVIQEQVNKAVGYFARLLEGEETQIGKLSTKEKLKEILKRIITILKAIFGNEKAKLKVAIAITKQDVKALQTFTSIENPTENQVQDVLDRLSNLSRRVEILKKFEMVSKELTQSEIKTIRDAITESLHDDDDSDDDDSDDDDSDDDLDDDSDDDSDDDDSDDDLDDDENFLKKISGKKPSELNSAQQARLDDLSEDLLDENIFNDTDTDEQFKEKVKLFEDLLAKEKENLNNAHLTEQQAKLFTKIHSKTVYFERLGKRISENK